MSRRYPIGAELINPNQTHFRVWAPKANDVDLVLEESAGKNAKRTFHPLAREEGGYFSGSANVGGHGVAHIRIMATGAARRGLSRWRAAAWRL